MLWNRVATVASVIHFTCSSVLGEPFLPALFWDHQAIYRMDNGAWLMAPQCILVTKECILSFFFCFAEGVCVDIKFLFFSCEVP